jgi:hypothetical protein
MQSHTGVLSALVSPTENFSFTLAGSYTDHEAKMDRLMFPQPADGLAVASYDYDLSTINEYSDLDIQQFGLELDVAYDITPELALGIGGAVYIYEDDAPYLFDDDGELYIGRVSLNYVF